VFTRLVTPFIVACIATPTFAQDAKPADPKAKDAVTYKDHVSPILRKHCINCHNPDKATSDLNVTTYQTLMTGGSSGESIQPGNPDQSLLYRVVAHLEEPHMPPKQPKIPEADLAVIKKWIELGAPETSAGAAKSASRKIDIDVAAVTTGKPEGPPPMPPARLPEVALPKTSRPHPITAMAASPWAPLLAVAGHERILLYNTDTLEPIGVLPFPERIPHVLKFSRNGKVLLAGGGQGAASGRVVLFDVTTGERITDIGDETDIVLAADISANHKLVALGGPSKIIKIYETETGELKHRIKKHTDWVTAMEFSPDGTLLATGDRNGGVYVWEAETGGGVFTLGDHREQITDMSWRSDGQMLATSSEDGRVILWYAEDGFPTRTINATAGGQPVRAPATRGKPAGVLAVAYAKDGSLATVGRDNSARLWQANGNQTAKLDGFPDVPSRVAFSHDTQRLFAGDFTGTVRVWTVKDKQPVGELTAKP
jgi:WD40 repeat protein